MRHMTNISQTDAHTDAQSHTAIGKKRKRDIHCFMEHSICVVSDTSHEELKMF